MSSLGCETSRGSRKTLDVPHFEIFSGENVAIIGANGAGKSTLLQVIACLLHPAEGRIRVGGRVVGEDISPIDARRRMAMVLQRPYLLDATVFANVAIGLKMRYVPEDEIQERVDEALALFGIGHLANRHGRSLSGGESQRVSLARALVLGPELLLLDEPMSSLDVPTRMALLTELGRIIKKTQVTTVFVTHDVTEIPFLADRTVIMEGGKIIADGPVREVLRGEMRSALSQLSGATDWLLMEDGEGLDVTVSVSDSRTEAWNNLKQYIKVGPRGVETVSILDAVGRVLAEDITAPIDLPGFARSTKDGYAVQASSTFGASEGLPAFFSLRGRIRMGECTGLSLAPHECAAIATGGMMPEGADAVVMVEMCEVLDDETIAATHSVAPGENVVGAQEDVAAGTLILQQGRRLRPSDIAALAAMGSPRLRLL